jgi:hypothetical protein
MLNVSYMCPDFSRGLFHVSNPDFAGGFSLPRCLAKVEEATSNNEFKDKAVKRGAISPRGIRSRPLDRCDHRHMQSSRDRLVLAQTSSSRCCSEVTLHRPILWSFSIRKLLRITAKRNTQSQNLKER